MAYSNLEEDQKEAEATGAGEGAYISGGGGGTFGSGAPTSAPTSSGSYTNIDKYLNANQGNAQRMGQAVGGQVDKQGTAADAAIGSYSTLGSQSITDKTVQPNQTVLQAIAAGTPQFDQGAVDKMWSAGEKPAQVAYSGPETAQADAYQGPTDYTQALGYGDAQQAMTGLGDSLNAVSTGNIQPFLQDVYGSGGAQYNAGENALDTFITRGNPQGRQELDNIGTKWGGMGEKFGNIKNALGGQIAEAKKSPDAVQKQYDREIGAGKTKAGDVNTKYGEKWTEYQNRPVDNPAEQPVTFAPDYNPFGGGNYNVDFGGLNKSVDAWNRSLDAQAYNRNMAGDGTFGGGGIATAANRTM